MTVAGQTIEQVARSVESRLDQGKLVVNPKVTVALEESQRVVVYVSGRVARPGRFELESGAGVAEALASAGGLTEFAADDRIFVLRKVPAVMRVRFTMRDLLQARGQAASFRLKSGDVVDVE